MSRLTISRSLSQPWRRISVGACLAAVLSVGCSSGESTEPVAEQSRSSEPRIVQRQGSPDIVPRKEAPKPAPVETVPEQPQESEEMRPQREEVEPPMVVERRDTGEEIRPQPEPEPSAIAMEGALEPIEVPPADPDLRRDEDRRRRGGRRSSGPAPRPTVAVPPVMSPYTDGFASAAAATANLSGGGLTSFGEGLGGGFEDGGGLGEGELITSTDQMGGGMPTGYTAPEEFIPSFTDDLGEMMSQAQPPGFGMGDPTMPGSEFGPTGMPTFIGTEGRPEEFLPNF